MKKILAFCGMLVLWHCSYSQCPATPLPTPLIENFSSVQPGLTDNNCWHSSTFFSPTWKAEDASGTDENSPGSGPLYDNTSFGQVGGIYIYLDVASGGPGDTAGFISPAIDLSNLTSPVLSFAYHMHGPAIGALEVDVWNGSSWDSLWAKTGQQQLAGSDPYSNVSISLSAYANQVIKLKFLGSRGSSFAGEIAIDDIRIDNPSACPMVSQPVANSVGSSDADIIWNTGSTGATAWEVQYDSAGFALGSGTVVPSTTDSLYLSGLSPNIAYQAYIREACAAGGFSNWQGPVYFKTACTPYSNYYSTNFDQDVPGTVPSCWSGYVSAGGSVMVDQFGTVQSSPNHLVLQATFPGFQDTIMAISPQFTGLTAGNKQVSFFASTNNLSTELYVGSMASQNGKASFHPIDTLSFTTANTPEEMIVYLDAAHGYNGTDQYLAFRHNLGGMFSNIFIDDFTYDTIPACPGPMQVQQTAATDTSVSLSFNSAGTDFDVEWGPIGFTQGTGCLANISSTSGNITLSNSLSANCSFPLQPNTTYHLYIRNNCTAASNGVSVWEGPISVKTACQPYTAPFYTGFENDLAGDLPMCWDQYVTGPSVGNSSTEVIDTDLPFRGSQHLRFDNLDNTLSIVVGPHFSDLSAGDKRVSFYARTSSTASGNAIVVGTLSSASAGQNFHPIDTLSLNTSDRFFNVEITTANGYNGSDEYIALYHMGSFMYRSFYIDEFTYEKIPACLPPLINTLGVASAQTHTVKVSWGSGSAGSKTYVEWGSPGFTPGTSASMGRDSVSGSVDFYDITGLTAQTSYEFYIRDSCTASGLSPWVGPYRFTTACTIFQAPFLEDFDGAAWVASNSNSGNQISTCWASDPPVSQAQNPFKWVPRSTKPITNNGPQSDLTGGNFMYAEVSGSIRGDSAFLLTPVIDLSSLNSPALYFWQHRQGSSSIPDMEVEISNDFGQSWSSVYIISGSVSGATASGWKREFVNLPAYSGDTIMLRFKQVSTDCCGEAAIDSIAVVEAPTCLDPTNLSLSAVLDTTAHVSWSGPANAGSYELWFGPMGFYQGSQTTGGSKVITGNASYVLDTLSPDSPYEVLVRGICAAGDSSNWIGPVQFTTLCSPTSMTYHESFDLWPASCWTPDLGQQPWQQYLSGNGDNYALANFWIYGNSSFVMNSPAIEVTHDAQVSFDWSHKYSFFAFNENLVVRVKLLNSTSWDTILELSGPNDFNDTAAGNSSPGSFIHEEIALDPAVYTGNTVQVQLWASSGNGADLFIDDFYLEPVPTCNVPSRLDTSAVGISTATLHWNGNNSGTGLGYEVEAGTTAFGTNTRYSTTSDSLALTGLSGQTSYCFWVREICGAGDTSQWAGPMCFTTPCPSVHVSPYTADFERLATGASLSFDNCWTASATGSWQWEAEDGKGTDDNTTLTGPLWDHTQFGQSGGVYMYTENNGALPGSSVDLISPVVNLDSLSNPQLSFWYFMHGAFINKLEVLVDSGSGFVVIDSLVGQQHTAINLPWTQRKLALNAYTGNIRVALRGYAGTMPQGDIAIDDIRLEEQPSCPEPSQFAVSGANASSVNFTWAGSANAQNYIVEFGRVGFTPGTGTAVIVSGTSAAVSSIPKDNLAREAYLRAYCAPGDSSVWVGPVAITSPAIPCDNLEAYNPGPLQGQSVFVQNLGRNMGDAEVSGSQGHNSNQSLHIYDSGFSNYASASAVTDTAYGTGMWNLEFAFYIPSGNEGHYDLMHSLSGFTDVSAIEVQLDASGTATVHQGDNGSGVIGSFGFGAGWNTVQHIVDLDNDTAWIRVNGNPTGLGWKFSLGSTNMAGQFKGISFSTVAAPARSSDMYIDDICISPYNQTSCGAPVPMGASDVGCDTAVVSWNSSSGSNSSILETGPSGFTPGTGSAINFVNSPYTLRGLTPGSSYDVYISDTCGVSGDTSTLAGPLNFTTTSGPLAAGFSYTADTAGANSRVLNFNANTSTGASTYSWDFGDSTTGSGMNVSHSYSTNGSYLVQLVISGSCGSDTITDSVLVEGISLYDTPLSRSLSVYPNPARDRLNISFTTNGSTVATIRVLDLSGKDLLLLHEDKLNGHFFKILDVSRLASGVYLLEITSGNHRSVRKIIME